MHIYILKLCDSIWCRGLENLSKGILSLCGVMD